MVWHIIRTKHTFGLIILLISTCFTHLIKEFTFSVKINQYIAHWFDHIFRTCFFYNLIVYLILRRTPLMNISWNTLMLILIPLAIDRINWEDILWSLKKFNSRQDFQEIEFSHSTQQYLFYQWGEAALSINLQFDKSKHKG